MDRLISLEPSNQVAIRVETGQKCSGELTLRNVMYTMPVAFRLEPVNRALYTVKPQSGIIAPLATLTVEITYIPPPNSALLPESFPNSDDSFHLHSVVVPGAAVKVSSSTFDSVPNEWFTAKKKQVFIDSGIKIFFIGSAVLTRLVAEGSMDSVREVLERSDSPRRAVDSVDAHGQTLLHLAIERRRADLIQLLLEFEPNLEAANRDGRTPLEEAASAGEALIVELLLARRASTARSQGSAWAPLHHTAAGGHAEVMRLLLLKGADPDARGADGRTPLHLAAEARRRDCVRLLLAAGARVEVRGGPDGGTPLHSAAASGDEQMVRLLLAKGGAGTKEIRNKAGRSAYELAAEGGYARLYDALRLGDELCAMARKGEARRVGRMVERGAAVNGRDQYGWTALMRAAFKGRVDLVKGLLEMGADVDARDDDGYTALHCAAEAGQAEAVEVLVKRGADLDARTTKGATAMQIAGSFEYAGIARILAQGGASKDGAPVPGAAPAPATPEKQARGKLSSETGVKAREKENKRRGRRMTRGGEMVMGGFERAALPVACSH